MDFYKKHPQLSKWGTAIGLVTMLGTYTPSLAQEQAKPRPVTKVEQQTPPPQRPTPPQRPATPPQQAVPRPAPQAPQGQTPPPQTPSRPNPRPAPQPTPQRPNPQQPEYTPPPTRQKQQQEPERAVPRPPQQNVPDRTRTPPPEVGRAVPRPPQPNPPRQVPYNAPRNTILYPIPHIGLPWGPFGYPWWWDNSPYYWNSWNQHTTVIYRDVTDKKVDKENYNIYRLATGTPVVLEDLVFDTNVLGYCDDQLEGLKNLRIDYMRSFWEVAIKYEGNEDKIRSKQLDVLEDYKHDLKDFLKNEKPKCR